MQQEEDVSHHLIRLEVLYGIAAHVVLPYVDDADVGCHIALIAPRGVDHIVLRIQRFEAAERGDGLFLAGALEHLLGLGEQVVHHDVLAADVGEFGLVEGIGVAAQVLLAEPKCFGDGQAHPVQQLLVLIVEHRLLDAVRWLFRTHFI